ncbi:hypothetical protein [Actinokineospora bangkokensis]|uniref:Ornithine cyclodeaminase n=1 Tax=Actinokineospora bangkokensis TaxID=1193682 RepID=A0A1Q9LKF4_9PSEU|nr:hypothetical protein [Actinokineospora bangkokensis]OLR92483.1 hypothetical protein BJP25_20645 [Actinokineospora bangkokensis]
MGAPILPLGVEELSAATAVADLVGVLSAALAGRAPVPACRVRPWTGPPAGDDAAVDPTPVDLDPAVLDPAGQDGDGLLLVEDDDARFLVPAAGLRAVHAAALATLAARELVAPGPVRAVVLGTGAVLRPQLTMIVRRLPTVRHITVHPAGARIDPGALAEVDLTSVTLSVAEDVGAAVEGARLVFAHDGAWVVPADRLAPGALVVRAGACPVRAAAAAVDQRFTDDPAAAGDAVRLADVLTGAHPGRATADAVVLVDLVGAAGLDLVACVLHGAARERGFGAGGVRCAGTGCGT